MVDPPTKLWLGVLAALLCFETPASVQKNDGKLKVQTASLTHLHSIEHHLVNQIISTGLVWGLITRLKRMVRRKTRAFVKQSKSPTDWFAGHA